MSVPRYLLDTNVLLRFLTGEPAHQAKAARHLFGQAASGEIVLDVSPVIVAETVYTLLSFYQVDRQTAAEHLAQLLRQPGVQLRDGDQVLAALKRLQTSQVGFADAFLAAGAIAETLQVASFDRDFDKLNVPRHEPKG